MKKIISDILVTYLCFGVFLLIMAWIVPVIPMFITELIMELFIYFGVKPPDYLYYAIIGCIWLFPFFIIDYTERKDK